jgi:hypothetical protein
MSELMMAMAMTTTMMKWQLEAESSPKSTPSQL